MKRCSILLLLLGSALLPLPAAASEAYAVTRLPTSFQPLPFSAQEGGTPPHNFPHTSDALLPFPFQFFGRTYTTAYISYHGYLTFGSGGTVDDPWAVNYAHATANSEIPPETRGLSRFIAPWWTHLDCRDIGTIKGQLLDVTPTRPRRQYVLEWRNCYPFGLGSRANSTLSMQIWLTEGSETIETRYGTFTGEAAALAYRASVGISTQLGEDDPIGQVGLACTPACNLADWPTHQAILYHLDPDLQVEAVEHGGLGYAGASLVVHAAVLNLGVRTAAEVRLRFYLSPTPELSDAAIDLGLASRSVTSDGTQTAPPGDGVKASIARGETARFSLEAALPPDLDPGAWFVIAQADPFLEVPDVRRDNNRGISEAVTVREGRPDLAVGSVSTSTQLLASGDVFHLSWTARNLGSAPVENAPYSIRLSPDEVISATDHELAAGTVSGLDALEELSMETALTLPTDVRPGFYRIGVLFDPDRVVSEIDETNNDESSERIRVVEPEIRILTDTLPAAELGAPWCVRLEASGGDGTYAWTLRPGSLLPPGLSLEERGGEGGIPATLLCGRPAALGVFSFSLQVRSGGRAAVQAFDLQVLEGATAPVITTRQLPVALFQRDYLAALGAAGGSPPYQWSLGSGSLPEDLHLQEDGVIVGTASSSGRFTFSVQLLDARGQRAEASLTLVISEPDRLTCISRELPPLRVGEPFSGALIAAGGVEPYRWTNRNLRRLAEEIGESGETWSGEPPPGLVLETSGGLDGEPTLAGRYVWTLDLIDAALTRESCTVVVDVGEEQRLSILTGGIPAAVTGRPYRTQLEAGGGSGEVAWSLHAGSALPPGLSLSASGLLEGTATVLPAGGEATFSFVVEARDAKGSRTLAPLSLTLLAEPERRPASAKEAHDTGCQASGQGPAGFAAWIGAALAAIRFRRRAR